MPGLKGLITTSQDLILDTIIPIAFSLCLLYFGWGIAQYIRHAGDEKALEEGKRTMFWGVIALFIVFSIWAIIALVKSELGLPDVDDVIKPL